MASTGYLDTDVIIRYLTGDDSDKQLAASDLFTRVDAREISLTVIDTVVADAVCVRTSPRQYGLSREDAGAMLAALLASPGFVLRNKRAVLDALRLFSSSLLDFGDCMIAATMRASSERMLYSYDRHFDRFDDIERVEP